MSKITISAILTILRIVLSLGEKILRTVYTVLDIVDDGVINASIPKPEWYQRVVSAISNIEFALRTISDVQDELSMPAKAESEDEDKTSSIRNLESVIDLSSRR